MLAKAVGQSKMQRLMNCIREQARSHIGFVWQLELVALQLPGNHHPLNLLDRSHAPRGNAALDALRQLLRRDAERHRMHSHAERGNEQL